MAFKDLYEKLKEFSDNYQSKSNDGVIEQQLELLKMQIDHMVFDDNGNHVGYKLNYNPIQND